MDWGRCYSGFKPLYEKNKMKMHWHPLDFIDGNSFFAWEIGLNIWCLFAVFFFGYLLMGLKSNKKAQKKAASIESDTDSVEND